MVLCGRGQAQRVGRIQSATRFPSETKRVALAALRFGRSPFHFVNGYLCRGRNMGARAAQT
jgi:hypothetical protein